MMKRPEWHEKGWGGEWWIANSPLYCGKKLVLKKGKRNSIHYHKIKDETFYMQSGLMQIDIYENGYPGKPTRRIMKPWDIIHLAPNMPHQVYGLEDSEFFEFSSQHSEEDVYRLVKGD